jgi:hypothetical protein
VVPDICSVRLLPVLLLVGAASAAETRGTIPEQFHGVWAGSESDCALGFPESILTIGAKQVDFYASRSRVLSIAVDGEMELAVLLEASGEGESWLATWQFRLSPDGKELTDMTGGRIGMKRILCSRAN